MTIRFRSFNTLTNTPDSGTAEILVNSVFNLQYFNNIAFSNLYLTSTNSLSNIGISVTQYLTTVNFTCTNVVIEGTTIFNIPSLSKLIVTNTTIQNAVYSAGTTTFIPGATFLPTMSYVWSNVT